MKIMACGKEHEVHVSPGADRQAECNEAIRKIVEHVEQTLCDLRNESVTATAKYGTNMSFYNEGRFDAYKRVKHLLDDNGYYTDL